MANITIKELLAADKISELVNKINFNFDQLLLNGGGPPGIKGGLGDDGPVGPRGTLWFTAADLYTTSISPSWSGIPERINDINLNNYPQFSGDPNKYLPVGAGSFPENSFSMGNTNKLLRDGDLYIQEGDDLFNSIASSDGDIWEYDGFTFTWIFTGVNIKGGQGIIGSAGNQQWDRDSLLTDDILYPRNESGQGDPRTLIGSSINVFNKIHPDASSTFISQGQPQIALSHEALHGGGAPDNSKMPTFTATSDGSLIIQGSQIGTSKQIVLQSDDSTIILSAGGSTYMGYSQIPDTVSVPQHKFTGGNLWVEAPNNANPHMFINASSNFINLTLSTTDNHKINGDKHIVFNSDYPGSNIGIGVFGSNTPVSKLAVAGGVSIGDAYKSIGAPANGLIVQGQSAFGKATLSGWSTMQSSGDISIDNGVLFLNGYYDGQTKRTTSNMLGVVRTASWVQGLIITVAPVGPANSVAVEKIGIYINESTANVAVGDYQAPNKLTVVEDSSDVKNVLNIKNINATAFSTIGIGAANNASTYAMGVDPTNNTFKIAKHIADLNSNTRIIIDSVGNVAIGQTMPTAKLDVQGTIKILGGNPAAGKLLKSTDTAGNAVWESPSVVGTVPTGAIFDWPIDAAPAGYVLCNGDAYAFPNPGDPLYNLFQLIGQNFMSTTFQPDFPSNNPQYWRVPDYRKRVSMGFDINGGTDADFLSDINKDNSGRIGANGGNAAHHLTASESGMPAHNHPLDNGSWVGGGPVTVDAYDGGSAQTVTNYFVGNSTSNRGPFNASVAHENRQPYIVMNKIIKL
jgi:microcystin-dependent protein